MNGLLRRAWLLALAIASASPALGASLAELAAAGRVRIDSAIAPGDRIVPGQRIALTVQIATDTWFSGGSRIRIPEVPGVVIVQSEQFAANASETRDGKPWVIQRWTLDVFPQRAGEFTVGPLPVAVRVNTGDGGEAAGELLAPARTFNVALPKSLAGIEQWVASPAFTVSQRFDRSLASLAVGDAFEQEIRFEATDVLAMMLPEVSAPRQPGLAAYPAPPQLDTRVNRGQILASRSVRISYVVERPGQFLLPARDVYWWNTQRAELSVVSVPETRIDVAGGAPQDGFPYAPGGDLRTWLLPALALALLLAGVGAARFREHLWPARRLSLQVRRLRGLFKPALPTRLNPGSSGEE